MASRHNQVADGRQQHAPTRTFAGNANRRRLQRGPGIPMISVMGKSGANALLIPVFRGYTLKREIDLSQE